MTAKHNQMRFGTNIEQLRANFETVTGAPFKHFFCPILHVDEDICLLGGHVVPESLGGRSRVLQRTDVDNDFGSFFEAEAADAILQGLDKSPLDTVLKGTPEDAKKVTRRFNVRAGFAGCDKLIDVSYRKEGGEGTFVVDTDDLRNALGDLPGRGDLSKSATHLGLVGVDLDARSSILVTSLRASHLAWFQICGYQYVFSPEGVFVASVLRSIYEKFILPRRGPNRRNKGSLISKSVKKEVDDWCFQFANLVRPLLGPSLESLPNEIVQGTLETGWFIALWDRDQVIGRVSIVKLGEQRIAVMTPNVFDARGQALIGLHANLELCASAARYSPEKQMFELAPPPHRVVVWPSADEETLSLPPISIEQAAQIVMDATRK